MLDRLEQIRKEGFESISAAPDRETLEMIRKDLTGKKSSLQEVLKSLGSLDPEMRRSVGMKANEVKNLFAEKIREKEEELKNTIDRQINELERIAELDRETARGMILEKLKGEVENESGLLIRNIVEDARQRAERESQKLLAYAIQRYAGDCTYERTTATIPLPNDEMKGRIIGREGRNIRALEAATGVNILIDDTPEAVVISCFDPVRKEVARRIGLFHDIGKAVDHEIEGTHAQIGADLLRKYGENKDVINAVAAHHGEVEATSIYAILANACDALSASRPGARSETTELYLKRLEQLESIAKDFPGVDTCYALQAGREVRVVVEPEKINEAQAQVIARDICNRIEKEMTYPGQIKVTIIRETRSVEYAK